MVFKCLESEFVGKTATMSEKLVNPHNALMYMVKDIPAEPSFIYSDVNLYLGENVFESQFKDGKLVITANEKNRMFVTNQTKVFAYYPKCYENSISDKEKIARETEEYIITEYKL